MDKREQIVSYGRRLHAAGLCPGTSGNLSIRDAATGEIFISPSGVPYGEMEAKDVSVLDAGGSPVPDSTRPSSEWQLHLAFYRAHPDTGAVVHTHAPFSTVFSVLRMPLKAVHYCIAPALADPYDPADERGAEVPVAPYHTFGTVELAEEAVRVCGKKRAVLLANHGILTRGEDLASAVSLMEELEYLATLQYRAMAIGDVDPGMGVRPYVLTPQEMAQAVERFSHYGQRPGEKKGY